MPRFPAHTTDNAPEASRETLEQLGKRMGKVLNIHAGMAHSPVVIAAYAGISTAIREHGTLDARTRETIALAVANENGCAYCQSAHTLSGKAAGLTEEQTVAIRQDRIDFDDRLASLASVVREAARNTGSVVDATWQQALDVGWTEEQLSETYAHVALNLFTNYFNHYAGTELDIELAPTLPA